MKSNIFFVNWLLDLKHQVLRSITVETRLDPVGVIEGASVEVHVHQTVVDAVVLDVDQVMVSVEVLASIILQPLSMTKLVIKAVLQHQPVPMILPGYQTSDSARSSKFHHLALLVLRFGDSADLIFAILCIIISWY